LNQLEAFFHYIQSRLSETIQDAAEDVKKIWLDNQRQYILLLGKPGVGKSTLVKNLMIVVDKTLKAFPIRPDTSAGLKTTNRYGIFQIAVTNHNDVRAEDDHSNHVFGNILLVDPPGADAANATQMQYIKKTIDGKFLRDQEIDPTVKESYLQSLTCSLMRPKYNIRMCILVGACDKYGIQELNLSQNMIVMVKAKNLPYVIVLSKFKLPIMVNECVFNDEETFKNYAATKLICNDDPNRIFPIDSIKTPAAFLNQTNEEKNTQLDRLVHLLRYGVLNQIVQNNT